MNKETKEVNVTLYHADWCGHCKRFKPEWDEMVAKFAKGDMQIKGANVKFESFEEKQLAEKKLNPTINGMEIQGWPTVKLVIDNKEYEYGGERKQDALVKFITEKLNGVQQGGKKGVDYRAKYKKYKQMYATLLKKYNQVRK